MQVANVKNAYLCCLALSLKLEDKVSFSNSSVYASSLNSYWAVQESSIEPLCIVSPKDVDDVSVAVGTLTTPNLRCEFAVRSGGHGAFAGVSNIQGGVTIDLSTLNSIEVGQGEPPIVSLGVGAKWNNVYSYLDSKNLSVNGGRVAGVGVGGLTLGGGISFSGPRFGWTCDTVQNFEVVLANGSVVNANDNENADLLWALRGGANNFGIVTRIDLQAFEQGNIWGAQSILPMTTVKEEIIAVAAFNDPATYDEYSSFISSFVYQGNSSFIVNTMEYTKPVENPLAFQRLLSLPALLSTQSITNLTSVAVAGAIPVPNGLRQRMATVTIESTVEAINATVLAYTTSVLLIQNVPNIIWSISMDIIPPQLYARHEEENALGLTNRQNKTLIIVDLSVSWTNADDDGTIDTAAKALIGSIERDVGMLGALDPFIYINYAASWQKPVAGYGKASTERLLKVRRKYDPHGVFTDLVPGGFKLP